MNRISVMTLPLPRSIYAALSMPATSMPTATDHERGFHGADKAFAGILRGRT